MRNLQTTISALALLAMAMPALAQRHDGGGSHGGGNRGGGSFQGGGNHGGGGFQGGGNRGGGGFQGGGNRGGGFHGGGFQGGNHGGGFHGSGFQGGGFHGGNRGGGFRSNIPVRTYHANEWRHYNPGWHERYYYRGGHYFYDNAYTYPAAVDNEWGGIAALSGGAAVLGFLNNDPYLGFAGTVGAIYSYSRYQSDLHSGDARYRARAAYFSRPSFWRGGRHYVRTSFVRNGAHYYRFRRG